MIEKHIKLEIAIETLACKIANIMKEIKEKDSEELKNELEILLNEREELYKGNDEIINKYS